MTQMVVERKELHEVDWVRNGVFVVFGAVYLGGFQYWLQVRARMNRNGRCGWDPERGTGCLVKFSMYDLCVMKIQNMFVLLNKTSTTLPVMV